MITESARVAAAIGQISPISPVGKFHAFGRARCRGRSDHAGVPGIRTRRHRRSPRSKHRARLRSTRRSHDGLVPAKYCPPQGNRHHSSSGSGPRRPVRSGREHVHRKHVGEDAREPRTVTCARPESATGPLGRVAVGHRAPFAPSRQRPGRGRAARPDRGDPPPGRPRGCGSRPHPAGLSSMSGSPVSAAPIL